MKQMITGLILVAVLTFAGMPRCGGADAAEHTIVVLGDSIAAGLGVEKDAAFPSVLGRLVKDGKYPFRVVNAGVSGDTTSGGSRRIDWLLKRPVDVLVIALGGNDGLRGIPPDTTAKNLGAIISRARAKNTRVRIVLVGMQIHQNMGPRYTAEFKDAFEKVAASAKVAFVPFLLEGVGGNPDLNQPDQIHPNAEGHRIVAGNVWKVLEPILKEMAATNAAPE